MKVCVIGGAGYIGSHVVLELIRKGHDIVVIDNLSTGYRDMVDEKATFYLGDITQKKDLTNIFNIECSKKKFDIVMHFAAKLLPNESMEKPLFYYFNNVEGVRILLETMVDFDIKNIVFSSTAAVYGATKEPVSYESEIPSPISPYGETKLASENMIKWVCQAHNMNYCIFRYFNVAGADESLKVGLKKDNITTLIPVAIQTALGIREQMEIFGDDYPTKDGTCERDYIHPTDLAIAHILGAEYILKNNKSLLLNLGSNEGFSVKEVIAEVSKYKPVKYKVGPRRAGDPVKVIASNEQAKKILGWSPKYNLEDIIRTDMEFRDKISSLKKK